MNNAKEVSVPDLCDWIKRHERLAYTELQKERTTMFDRERAEGRIYTLTKFKRFLRMRGIEI